jgi:hypothetical protein
MFNFFNKHNVNSFLFISTHQLTDIVDDQDSHSLLEMISDLIAISNFYFRLSIISLYLVFFNEEKVLQRIIYFDSLNLKHFLLIYEYIHLEYSHIKEEQNLV